MGSRFLGTHFVRYLMSGIQESRALRLAGRGTNVFVKQNLSVSAPGSLGRVQGQLIELRACVPHQESSRRGERQAGWPEGGRFQHQGQQLQPACFVIARASRSCCILHDQGSRGWSREEGSRGVEGREGRQVTSNAASLECHLPSLSRQTPLCW